MTQLNLAEGVKRGSLIAFILIILLSGVVYISRPVYKHRFIELKGCNNVFVTEIEYTKPFYRAFIYTYGKYKENSVPDSNCIISSRMTGYDAILELWIACENNQVTFFPTTGDFYIYTKKNPNIILGKVEAWKFNDKVAKRTNVTRVLAE